MNCCQRKPEKPTLYYDDMTPPSRSCLMLITLLNIDCQLVYIDLCAGAHMSTEYGLINPERRVPTLYHKNIRLTDSHTILIYLTDISGTPCACQLLPQCYLQRLYIMNLMFVNGCILLRRYSTFMGDILRKPLSDDDVQHHEDRFAQAYDMIENYLKKTYFMAGRQLTLADISMVATVSAMDVTYPLLGKEERWPNLAKWFYLMCLMPSYKCCLPGIAKQRELTNNAIKNGPQKSKSNQKIRITKSQTQINTERQPGENGARPVQIVTEQKLKTTTELPANADLNKIKVDVPQEDEINYLVNQSETQQMKEIIGKPGEANYKEIESTKYTTETTDGDLKANLEVEIIKVTTLLPDEEPRTSTEAALEAAQQENIYERVTEKKGIQRPNNEQAELKGKESRVVFYQMEKERVETTNVDGKPMQSRSFFLETRELIGSDEGAAAAAAGAEAEAPDAAVTPELGNIQNKFSQTEPQEEILVIEAVEYVEPKTKHVQSQTYLDAPEPKEEIVEEKKSGTKSVKSQTHFMFDSKISDEAMEELRTLEQEHPTKGARQSTTVLHTYTVAKDGISTRESTVERTTLFESEEKSRNSTTIKRNSSGENPTTSSNEARKRNSKEKP